MWAELAPNLSELLQEGEEANEEDEEAGGEDGEAPAKIEIDFSSEIDEDKQKLGSLF